MATRSDLRPESLRRYRDATHVHLVPALGRIPRAKLTPLHLQAAYVEFRAKGLSGTTLQLIHGVPHAALADAVRWGLVARNVAGLVTAPRPSTPEMQTLGPKEATRLLLATRGDPLEALYVLALTAGLRLGELQALKSQAVALTRARLHAVATYQGLVDGQPVFAQPKSDGSRRSVHLSGLAVTALRAHHARQRGQRLLAAPRGRTTGSSSRTPSAGRSTATTAAPLVRAVSRARRAPADAVPRPAARGRDVAHASG